MEKLKQTTPTDSAPCSRCGEETVVEIIWWDGIRRVLCPTCMLEGDA